ASGGLADPAPFLGVDDVVAQRSLDLALDRLARAGPRLAGAPDPLGLGPGAAMLRPSQRPLRLRVARRSVALHPLDLSLDVAGQRVQVEALERLGEPRQIERLDPRLELLRLRLGLPPQRLDLRLAEL